MVVHGWVSHMFGLSLGSFDLWMCTSSTELETNSNGCVLGIGHVMVCTSHVVSEHGGLSSCLWLCHFYLDGYGYSLSYYRCYIHY
jgi:hypothetical protein